MIGRMESRRTMISSGGAKTFDAFPAPLLRLLNGDVMSASKTAHWAELGCSPKWSSLNGECYYVFSFFTLRSGSEKGTKRKTRIARYSNCWPEKIQEEATTPQPFSETGRKAGVVEPIVLTEWQSREHRPLHRGHDDASPACAPPRCPTLWPERRCQSGA